jgi:3-O-methylgallate 3,4-dioxygenase
MARIAFGIGTSHSSQLSLKPEDWAEQAELDRARTPYEQLLKHADPAIVDQLSPTVQSERHDRAQVALSELRQAIATHQPDVLVIVGDDQGEIFPYESVPAIAMTLCPEMKDIPPPAGSLDPIRQKAAWAFHASSPESYPMDSGLAQHLAQELTTTGFDITVLREQPEGRSLGHAWTFIHRRLLDNRSIPMVPVFLNTYFPPNQPSPRRCIALGRALAEAVRSYPEGLSVGFVASGGLSHFVIDEALDRRILSLIGSGDMTALASEAPEQFTSGTSEILNWMTVAAALETFDFEILDYIPGYRSPAGTGCGFAFAKWSKR